jgi:carboxylesterase
VDTIHSYINEAVRTAKASGVKPADHPYFWCPTGPARTVCIALHGSTATPRQMAWFARKLLDGKHAVLAPLLPGHGTSREALQGITPADCLAEVQQAVDACLACRTPPFLLGYSFGAVLALWVATTRPVTGAVSLAGGCKPRLPLLARPAMLCPQFASALPRVGDPEKATAWKLRVGRFAMSLRYRVRLLRVPLFLWHSTRDRTMLAKGSVFLFRNAASAFKELLLTEGPGHPLAPSPELETVGEAVVRFLTRDHAVRDVVFGLDLPEARSVELTGSFNSWGRHRLAPAGGGHWEVVVPLRPGRYEYAFLADGVWYPDPHSPAGPAWPDGRVPSALQVT